MKHRIPLSPTQTIAFAMGRTLILFDSWYRQCDQPLDIERAMLLDFASQHPRSVTSLVPGLEVLIRAHGLAKHDLSDAFARRRFGTTREQFIAVVGDLVARDLLAEDLKTAGSEELGLRPTETGRSIAEQFISPLGLGFKAVCGILAGAWRKKNVRELASEIRKAIPDESMFASNLREPFARWLMEVD